MKVNNLTINETDIGVLEAKRKIKQLIGAEAMSPPNVAMGDISLGGYLEIGKPADLEALIKASFQKEQAEQSLDSIIADKIKEKEAMNQLENRLHFATDTNIWGHLMAKGYSVVDISLSLFEQTAKALEANTDKALLKQQKQLAGILHMTPHTVKYLIKNDVNLSIESIYKAQFMKDLKENRTDGLLFDQVSALLTESFPDTNKDLIRFLFEGDIDITTENIEKLEFLVALPTIISKDMVRFFNDREIIFNQRGKSSSLPKHQGREIEVFENHLIYHAEKNEKIKEQLQTMDNQLIAEPLENTMKDRLENRQQIVFQKQIRELQLKLTTQVIFSLAKQGLSIDSLTIEEALNKIDGLNEILYREHLEVFTNMVSEADLAQMTQFFHGIDQLPDLEPTVYYELYKGRIQHKMTDISLMNEELKKQKLAENLSIYETKPQVKFGDSFLKVASSQISILESLELPTDFWHMKGIEILSMNEIDVTRESALHMTGLFKELDYIAHHMTPHLAAELISGHVDIMATDIKELAIFIQGKQGGGEGDIDLLVADYILETKNLDSELREDMMDFYHSLHQIMKKDGLGLGLVERMGMKLQLKDILTANKYIEKTKLSKPQIDMEASPTKEGAHTESIETYEGWGRNKTVIENILKVANPQVLEKTITDKDIKEKVLQELLGLFQETKAVIGIEENMLVGEYVDMASYLEPADMEFMNFYQIPETLENLHNAHMYRQHKEKLFTDIDNNIAVSDLSEAEKEILQSPGNPKGKWELVRNRLVDSMIDIEREAGEANENGALASFISSQRQMQFIGKYNLGSPILIDDSIGGLEIHEITQGVDDEMATVFMSLFIHGRQIEDTFIAKRADIEETAYEYLERFKQQIKDDINK